MRGRRNELGRLERRLAKREENVERRHGEQEANNRELIKRDKAIGGKEKHVAEALEQHPGLDRKVRAVFQG